MKILEHYIVPVVRFSDSSERILVESVHGTAFFVNDQGAFVTAAHVVKECMAEVEKKGGHLGLAIRQPGVSSHLFVGEISVGSFAEYPYDIAVGVINQPSKSCFAFGDSEKVLLWENVYTAGYPATAITVVADKYNIL